MDLNHEEMKGYVASYVLGALPPEEVAFVRSHILSCDECMAEADDLSAATESMALAVDSVPLPAGFADRVLEQAIGPQAVSGITGGRPAKTGRRWTFLPVMTGLAMLIAFGVMTTTVIQTRNDAQRKEQALTALLHSSDGLALEGSGGAVGRLVPSAGESYLVLTGLDEAPKNHVYQLWLLQGDDAPVSARIFDVSEGVAIVRMSARIEGFEGAAITVEPAGGSVQPTTDPIMISSSA